MNCKAILSNKAHPEYGQATVPFPIQDSEYDHTIGLLEDMGIGSPAAQDCRVDGLDSPYPVLNRLVTQSANVDELDYLARRLDSFSEGEAEKFQAMASRLRLSDIKDFHRAQVKVFRRLQGQKPPDLPGVNFVRFLALRLRGADCWSAAKQPSNSASSASICAVRSFNSTMVIISLVSIFCYRDLLAERRLRFITISSALAPSRPLERRWPTAARISLTKLSVSWIREAR